MKWLTLTALTVMFTVMAACNRAPVREEAHSERAEATAAGRPPVVSVSDTLQPDPFLVGFFSPITDRVPSTRNGAQV